MNLQLRKFAEPLVASRSKLLLATGLLALSATGAGAANIAITGTGIIGVNNEIDGDAGTPRPHSGAAGNVNDGDPFTRSDTWWGDGTTDQGQGVSFVGVTWPSKRYESVEKLVLTLATFGDGGWFGANGIGPAAGGPLTSAHVVEPTVQIRNDAGTWVTVPHTSDYTAVMTGHTIGGGGNPNPSTATTTFTLNTPATEITGIRIIGRNGGVADGNGFIGVFEVEVDAAAAADTDADGLPDGWETANGLQVGANDAELDKDSDGLVNVQEFNLNTNPSLADTDGDGLNDADEVNTRLTNPVVADSDGDGLSDGAEVNTHSTDPNNPDTDGDGLSDGAEVNTHTTNPNSMDTDNDGYADNVEISQGSDPKNAAIIPNNQALTGTGYLGVKDSMESGPETERELYHVGTPENIVDGNLTTRVDTYNGGETTTVSFVGVLWSAPVAAPIETIDLTLATFFDGGWFGLNGQDPGAGGALAASHVVEPEVQVTTDGVTWTTVPHTSDYVAKLVGHRIGGGGLPNPTTVTATFELENPAANITGIRLIGTDGGRASGGFLGVFEFAARSSSSDVDNDGLDDSWERQHGLLVGTNDAAADPDSDGLTNLQEFNLGTAPKTGDTDGDGLNDGAEENTHNTDPTRPDSDGDTLTDGAEVNTHGTNPLQRDTDGDLFTDNIEVAQGTNPTSATSFPPNLAPAGTPLIGTSASIEAGPDTPHANAGPATAVNDFNLGSRVDTWNGGGTDPFSYVGVLWNSPVAGPITTLKLAQAVFFDGGWFGAGGIGPGAGGSLSEVDLVEPTVQVTTDGTTWTTIAHTSDYMTVMNGHPLPAVAFGEPTTANITFTLNTPQTNIRGIRIIGSEGGTASGGFIGVFELQIPIEAPDELEIENLSLTGGQIRFEFDSKAGTTYLVEYKTSLSDPNWQTLRTITGDGTTQVVTDSASAGNRFYRVRTQN